MRKFLIFLLLIVFVYSKKIIEVKNCFNLLFFQICTDCITNYDEAENTIKDALNDVTDNDGTEIVICKRNSPYYESYLPIKYSNIYIHSNTNNPNDVIIEGDGTIFNFNNNWVNDINISGISIYQTSSGAAAIYNSEGGSDWNFSNLIINSQGYGIYSSKIIKNLNIINSEINSSKDALNIKNPKVLNIIDSNISSSDGYIAYINESYSDVNFSSDSKNLLEGEYGIYFKGGYQNYYVNNFKIITTGNEAAPIGLDEAAYLDVENCDLNASSNGSGIYIGGKINKLNIKNNYIHDLKYEGIYIQTLYQESNISNNIIYGGDYGIYLLNLYDNLNIFSNDLENASSANLYVNTSYGNIDIEKNIFNNSEANIYINDTTKPAIIKENIIKNSSDDSGIHLLNSYKYVGSEILYNCFFNNKTYQVYNLDLTAIFDDGERGNYWSDWNGNGDYVITKVGIDHHPLSNCNLYFALLDYRMDECSWDNDPNTYEIKNYGTTGSEYNATSLNDANVTEGKICNGGDIISDTQNDKAVKLENDFPLPEKYTLNVWIKFPLNTDGHKVFSYGNRWNRTRVKYFNIADRSGSNSDFIYFEQNLNDNTWTLNVKDDSRKDSYSFNPQNLSGWHMLTFVVNDSNTTFYLDGEEKHTFSTHPNTGYLGLLFNSDFGSSNDDEPNGQSIGADVDEFELFYGNLTDSDILSIYNNENNGKNYDGSTRTCPICEQNTQKNYSFNAVSKIIYNNSVEDWDNNLSTQIVNKPFNIYILSKNKDLNIPEEANITKVIFYFYNSGDNSGCSGTPYGNQVICDDSTSNECPDTNISGEAELKNINVNQSVKCVNVYIAGKEINFTGYSFQDANSTDDFAIRPYKFNIINIPSKIYAGEEFNLTIQALDYNGNPAKDYNETLSIGGNSPELNYTEENSQCLTGTLNKINGGEFKDGETNVTLTYSEVGDLNVTIKEINGSEYASVDSDDTPDNQRFITSITKTVTVVPHHFEVDVKVNNFDDNFTYLDNNLTIYSLIDLNITAQNEQNQTTKNYNEECYAKNVDVNLTPYIYRHSEELSKDLLYKILYVDTNSSVYKNSDINFSVGESNFTTDNNGSALIKIYVNFERNISNPINPFEYNISGAEVNDNDVNLTYLNTEGNATFYYGGIFMKDIITSENDFNISQKIIMYDDNSSDTYKPDSDEVLLNWYQNSFNHLKDANISNFAVTKGYVYNSSDDISDKVEVTVNEINDSVNLNIKRLDTNINFVVIHIIDSNASHLWYSKYGNEYNISQGSSCVNHFCFTVTWPKNNENSGILSGDVNGTKADVNESNVTKRGVKIFR